MVNTSVSPKECILEVEALSHLFYPGLVAHLLEKVLLLPHALCMSFMANGRLGSVCRAVFQGVKIVVQMCRIFAYRPNWLASFTDISRPEMKGKEKHVYTRECS